MGNAMGLMFLISAAEWVFTGDKRQEAWVFALMFLVKTLCCLMHCIYKYGCYIPLISNTIFRC